MRDIITHHYFDVDVEVSFDVCKNHIEALAHAVRQMIDDLNR